MVRSRVWSTIRIARPMSRGVDYGSHKKGEPRKTRPSYQIYIKSAVAVQSLHLVRFQNIASKLLKMNWKS
jgi:hypothetical protein